ncbi:EVE domain-containing protein [Kordiimonas sp. SCSIO 12610]|uniref:EVE domain-containing protein n=1 Tax=Kordiimonas sp. SCSIO 12610 TaxID=2829597 RepID=UPI00210A6F59|nr:EVE domain-containing protein [Kordiimonas sp. SCSIO 12610]UTW55297.1 EVE domain-containing protein [Kordiimonas sp. SCSIO 12610]
MRYWLVKSEPDDWSWDDQLSVDFEPWDGVRNFQAQKNMRSMQNGDQVLFYHSGKAREIVGVCEVVREAYPDPDDQTGKFCLIDLKAVKPVQPIALKAIKANDRLHHLALVKQPRLSVMPIDEAAWKIILSM